LPIRYPRSTETIPPLIPYPGALYVRCSPFQLSNKSVAKTRERLSFQQTVAAHKPVQGRENIKAQGVRCQASPLGVVDTSLNHVVVALRQVYPSIESLFDGGSDKQTFMSLACGSACSVTMIVNGTSRLVLAVSVREMCESVMQGRVGSFRPTVPTLY
jgi:hypothetical protein